MEGRLMLFVVFVMFSYDDLSHDKVLAACDLPVSVVQASRTAEDFWAFTDWQQSRGRSRAGVVVDLIPCQSPSAGEQLRDSCFRLTLRMSLPRSCRSISSVESSWRTQSPECVAWPGLVSVAR
jgi:hypothetical protein